MSFFFVVTLLVADQISKIWARTFDAPITVIPGWVQLQLVFNDGFAFSLPAPQWILVGVAIAISVGLGVLVFFKKFRPLARWGAVLVIAGALGNAIDRIFFGVVTDFFAVAHFPVFNLADTWVTIGAVLLILDELFGSRSKK